MANQTDGMNVDSTKCSRLSMMNTTDTISTTAVVVGNQNDVRTGCAAVSCRSSLPKTRSGIRRSSTGESRNSASSMYGYSVSGLQTPVPRDSYSRKPATTYSPYFQKKPQIAH